MKSKLISALLAAVMLISAFTACAEKNTEKTNARLGDVVGDLIIDGSYTIVRSETANSTTVKAATLLRSLISERSGVDVPISTDYLKKDTKPSNKEILVGKTNRETEFDRATLGEGEYYIGVDGEKIIIDAYDHLTLYVAISEIVEKYFTMKEGNCMIAENTKSELGMAAKPQPVGIKVMSQNIRYANDGEGKNVADRAPRFKQLVEMYQPDLIGTQETTALWNKYYSSYFKDVYGMVGCSREGRDATDGEWGTILYRLDRFELLDSDDFWLTRTPTAVTKVPGSACNRICTWALLKDKITGKTFVMANTHLDYITEEVKQEQYKYLYAGLSEFLDKYPVFLTGDFNADTNSGTYKTVTKDFHDPYVEAFENRSTVNHTADGYGSSGGNGSIIDYCFYNDKSTALWYKILSEQFGGYISDHFGVISEFVIK